MTERLTDEEIQAGLAACEEFARRREKAIATSEPYSPERMKQVMESLDALIAVSEFQRTLLPRALAELQRLRERDVRLGESIKAAIDELVAEAEKFEDAYNSDDYDGDLDADEAEAEIRWHCIRQFRQAAAELTAADRGKGEG